MRSLPGRRAGEVRLVQDDPLADGRVDLGDAVAHQPGAGHEDALDRHPGIVPGARTTGRTSVSRTTRRSTLPPNARSADTTKMPPNPIDAHQQRRGSRATTRTRGRRTRWWSRRRSPAPSRPRVATARAMRAGNRKAIPNAKIGRPDIDADRTADQAEHTEPEGGSHQRDPRQASRADLVGELRKDDPERDHDERVHRERQSRRRPSRARSCRAEGTRSTPPCPRCRS